MSVFRGYVGARSCTDGPQPGVVNFQDAALKTVPESHSDGIYNCRPVRGSTTTTSLHGEGRAFDWGCAKGALWAAEAADFLVEHSKQLGIQCVIYDRRIWSGAHPDAGWRPYHGVDAHTTHLHIEFSWAAAEHLTEAQAAHYLAPLGDEMDPADVGREVAKALKPYFDDLPGKVAAALAAHPLGRGLGVDDPGSLGIAIYRIQSELMRISDLIPDAALMLEADPAANPEGREAYKRKLLARDIDHPGEKL